MSSQHKWPQKEANRQHSKSLQAGTSCLALDSLDTKRVGRNLFLAKEMPGYFSAEEAFFPGIDYFENIKV